MGQSFLTHDEKSTGSSPSPDLLQCNGVGGGSQPKFFGSLSSIKETSASTSGVSSSSRSPFEDARSERSCATSTSSASPRSLPTAGEEEEEDGDGIGGIHSPPDVSYSDLVPTPIQPGNVSRLREKFMDLGISRERERGSTTPEPVPIPERSNVNFNFNNENREVVSDVDCRSPGSGGRRTLPASISASTSPRNRSSLYNLNPASYHYQHRHHRHSSGGVSVGFPRNSRTLPFPSPSSSSARASFCRGAEEGHNKTDGLGLPSENNDLSSRFREMSLASSCTVDNLTRETPLVRQRPRTRPYVPPPLPRSVIIRSGYLPEVQTVNFLPGRSATATHNLHHQDEAKAKAQASSNIPKRSQSDSECYTSTISPVQQKERMKSEDLHLLSPSSSSKERTTSRTSTTQVVTNKEDHTEKVVLRKDAEVNTSAEVLVLPKGTKTSVLLKTAGLDAVDGKRNKLGLGRRRRKKRGIRRIARVFARVMIRFVEIF